jgi:hypothetical protein
MQKKNREEIPPETAALVLFLSDRTCCVCRVRGKPIQIHHIDENPGNNEQSNLAVLCLDCHRETQIHGGFDRKLEAQQILLFRDDWQRLVSQKLSDLYASAPNAAPLQKHQLANLIDRTGEYLLHAEEPIIIWRMPRGILILSKLLPNLYSNSVADYCSYNGAWRGSTHYHVSYHDFWWKELGGIELQYRKLQIERGDWEYAVKPLKLMSEILHKRLIVQPDGTLKGNGAEQFDDPELMKVFINKDVPFPHIPERYFRLSISGPLRDLAGEVNDLCEGFSIEKMNDEELEDTKRELKGFRRAARIEAHKVLAKDDPAMLNLLEVIEGFDHNADFQHYQIWSKELRAVLYDAVHQVHETRQ